MSLPLIRAHREPRGLWGKIVVVEFQENGGYRAIGPIKGTWKSEGLVDPEQLGRWGSKGQGEAKRKVKEDIQFEK